MTSQLAAEQARIDEMYARWDAEVAEVQGQIPESAAEADRLRGKLRALHDAEAGLCFGRIDYPDGTNLHIGRKGLWAGGEPLLVDWRAEAAAPFYAATPRNPMGLRRRRHLRITGRTVQAISDEILNGDDPGEDAIVRSAHRGITVVEGGPGTGKTVVALHRAAYVLFAFPAMADQKVLVVGPDRRFLDYIDQGLPSLGENGVRLTTKPGSGQRELGRAHWATDLADRVNARRPAPRAVRLAGTTVHLGEALAAARDLPHNPGRARFKDYLIAELTRQRMRDAEETLRRIEEETRELVGNLDAAVAADLRSLGLDSTPAEAPEVEDPEAVRKAFEEDERLDAEISEWWPRLTIDDALPPEAADDLALRDEVAALIDGPPGEVYGHIVVDEAQELTEMDWRYVLRRCPSRSMTVVGDFAQAGPASTVRDWPDVLGPRLERHTLTVNYRTTAEILESTRDLLAEIAPDQQLSRSVRHGEPPAERFTTEAGLAATIRAETRPGELTAVIRAGDVAGIRGLEFDAVLVIAPAEFAGPRDLYVAMTRATNRVCVIHVADRENVADREM